MIARDRSTEYALAAAAGAPKAVQVEPKHGSTAVANRWHLLSNVCDMLERWLARAHARLRRLPVSPGGDGRQAGQRTHAYRRGAVEAAATADSRARWLAAYEDVRRRYLAGERLLAIRAVCVQTWTQTAPASLVTRAVPCAFQGLSTKTCSNFGANGSSRATGLARATVRKYAHAESFPKRAVCRPGRSNLDPTSPTLRHGWRRVVRTR